MFFFLAPITNVTLYFNQNSVNISEQMRLTCVSEYCYPSAHITWYIGSDVVSESIIDNVSSGNDGLFQTTSTLQYTGVEADNGKPVYCKASNLHNITVESSRKYLDVICKSCLSKADFCILTYQGSYCNVLHTLWELTKKTQ